MPNTREKLIYADDFLDLFYVASAGQDKAFIKTVEMVVEDTPTVSVITAIDIANGVTVQKWIPVTERLPEQYETVIGWDGYFMGEVEHNGKCFTWMDYDGWNDIADITHWMPFPKPPKGE